jgi:Prokaryotic E2 family E
MKSIHEQFAEITKAFPGATLTPVNGLHLVVIPNVPLPRGWSQPTTHIRFVIPNGYPYAAPDCFWADHALRLDRGQIPQNAQVGNLMPGQPDPNTLWFSWHVNASWNPATCELITYVKVIRSRFEALQ